MRHRVAYRKLGRVSEHRIALLRNQAHMLLLHERIKTTVPKAKELQPFVERLITVAKRGLDGSPQPGRAVIARRLVRRDLADRATLRKLFETIAPRFESRPGGYTRLLRLGYRRGDSAEMAQVELVGSEYQANVELIQGDEIQAPASKGVGGRLRAAAQRIRGRKAKGSDTTRADRTIDEEAVQSSSTVRRRSAKKNSRKKSS